MLKWMYRKNANREGQLQSLKIREGNDGPERAKNNFLMWKVTFVLVLALQEMSKG